jgi:hypothetical protein
MTTEETTQAVATAERKIRVVSTAGAKNKVINFSGSKWKELKEALYNEGYKDLDSMKCVESINRHTLEHPEADVPQGDFNLFLMPQKSKSGGLPSTRGDLYNTIKTLKEKDPEGVSAHFGNYTQKSTNELASLVDSYGSKATVTNQAGQAMNKVEEKEKGKKEGRKEKAKAITDVVSAASTNAQSKEDKHAALYEEFRSMSTDDKLFFVATVLLDLRDAIHGKVPVPAETTREESEEEKAARLQKEEDERIRLEKEAEEKAEAERKRKEEEERKRKEKEEEDKLMAEANELAMDMPGVDRNKMRRY